MTAATIESVTILLGAAIKTSLVVTLAYIVTWGLGLRSAALRHAVWATAFLSIVLLPIFGKLIPSWEPRLTVPIAQLVTPSLSPPLNPPPTVESFSVWAALTPAPIASLPWPVVLWIIGCCAFGVALIIGTVRLAWISYGASPSMDVRCNCIATDVAHTFGLTRRIQLLEHPDASMPFTWGLVRPRVLLPANSKEWSAERMRVVLSHELAHIRRHDWGLQIAAELVRVVYWFNPLLWVACRKLRNEGEHACDDAVLCLGIDGREYAAHLLDVARTLKKSQQPWSTVLAMACPSNLERRFAAMVNPSVDRRPLTYKGCFVTALAALAILMPLAAVHAPAQITGPAAGSLSGNVYDAKGIAIPNATIVVTSPDAAVRKMTTSSAAGTFELSEVPAGQYDVDVLRIGFVALHIDDVSIETNHNLPLNAMLPSETSDGKVSQPSGRVRVGGNILSRNLIQQVRPIYPAAAKQARVQGLVPLEAVIGANGRVLSLRVFSPDVNPDLARAAVQAVSQWTYKPVMVNEQPVEAVTTVTVNFAFKD